MASGTDDPFHEWAKDETLVYYHVEEEQSCDMDGCGYMTTRMAKFEGRDEDFLTVCEDGGHTDDEVRMELTVFIETYR